MRESPIGGIASQHLGNYLEKNDLGIVVPADGALRILPGLVSNSRRFVLSDAQLPDGDLFDDAIPDLFPDLAVEVLSKGNTKEEMERKLRDYFRAGTQIVWLIDPKKQIVDVYGSPTERVRQTKDDVLDGGQSVARDFNLP